MMLFSVSQASRRHSHFTELNVMANTIAMTIMALDIIMALIAAQSRSHFILLARAKTRGLMEGQQMKPELFSYSILFIHMWLHIKCTYQTCLCSRWYSPLTRWETTSITHSEIVPVHLTNLLKIGRFKCGEKKRFFLALAPKTASFGFKPAIICHSIQLKKSLGANVYHWKL